MREKKDEKGKRDDMETRDRRDEEGKASKK